MFQLLGYLLNWALYGALSVQVCQYPKCHISSLCLYSYSQYPADWYYLAFPNDKWTLKTLVTFTYTIDTAQTIIATNDCFKTYAYGFGDVNKLLAMDNGWLTVPVMTSIGAYNFYQSVSQV